MARAVLKKTQAWDTAGSMKPGPGMSWRAGGIKDGLTKYSACEQ